MSELGSERDGVASPISDERLEQGYRYWRGKAGQRLPRRADIEPAEIPKLLPHVMLVDVVGNRYRYRLIGTANEQAQGLSATGRYLDEVLKGPEYKDHVIALYDSCVRESRPLYSECLFLALDAATVDRHIKVLFLPLSDDGDKVNMVLVVQVYRFIDVATRDRHFLDERPYKEIVHVLL